jgi:hypothetical protein
VKTIIRFLSDLLIERFFMGHYMRWLEMRTRQVPGSGINVKKPWRGGFWICPKEWFDTNEAIQGRSSTRGMVERREVSCSSRSYRSLLGEDEPGTCLILDEHFYS